MAREVISPATIGELPLAAIERVTFYKRDELCSDLICCDVEIGGRTCFFHEETEGWERLLRHLEKLPGFRSDWFEAVSQPPFECCATIAYERGEADPASG